MNLRLLDVLAPSTFPPRLSNSLVLDSKQSFERFDALISEAETAIDLLQERRSALISAAVTGKIDVRAEVPDATEAA